MLEKSERNKNKNKKMVITGIASYKKHDTIAFRNEFQKKTEITIFPSCVNYNGLLCVSC
jgi:hypothetical protein